MIKLFRPHRGSYIDSMRCLIEVKGIRCIKQMYGTNNILITNDSVLDNRNGWDTHRVLNGNRQCVGFVNFYE